MHIAEPDVAVHLGQHLALVARHIDLGHHIQQLDAIPRRRLGVGDVGYKRKGIRRLDGSKHHRRKDGKVLARSILAADEQLGAVPESEADDPELQRLRDGIEKVAVEGRVARDARGLVELLAVDVEAVFFARERRHDAHGARCLARLGRTSLVRLFDACILEHHELQPHKARRERQRDAGNHHQRQLPSVGERNDRTRDERRDALDDGAERDADEAVDLLRVVGERVAEATGRVRVLVVVRHVGAQVGKEAHASDALHEHRARLHQRVRLDRDR
ncbi:hypothetical protein L1887_57275 [Cichorium endivia]|nr:hypothetical protein L1887_57275 [Cichorium endivia]